MFLTETEAGSAHLATAGEITETFGRSVFLSGCKSGQSGVAARSMAESLVQSGAGAVLGWGSRCGIPMRSWRRRFFMGS